MTGESKVVSVVLDEAIEYLKATPKAAGFLFMSFMSGHLWAFMVIAHRSKTKGNDLLKTIHGRTAIGLLWFSFILVPTYFLKFRGYDFKYDQVLDSLIPVVILGLFLQLIVFLVFVFFGERK